MSPSPIRAHISQSLDVVLQLPSQIVLQCHRAQFCREGVHLSLAQVANLCSIVDMELRHQVSACEGTDAVEGAEGARDEGGFLEVVAMDEDLGGG